MNYSTYRFTLDIHRTKSQVSIPVPHTDTSVQFFINLTDGGKPYHIEDGCRAVLYGKKADGTPMVDDCEIIDNGTRINYTFTEQTASVVGPVDCEIRLYGSNGLHFTTPSFCILVETRVVEDDEIIESEPDLSAIDRMFLEEEERTKAEEARVAAEEARVAAEEARVEAEEKREALRETVGVLEETIAAHSERLDLLDNSLSSVGLIVVDGKVCVKFKEDI